MDNPCSVLSTTMLSAPFVFCLHIGPFLSRQSCCEKEGVLRRHEEPNKRRRRKGSCSSGNDKKRRLKLGNLGNGCWQPGLICWWAGQRAASPFQVYNVNIIPGCLTKTSKSGQMTAELFVMIIYSLFISTFR